MYSPKSTPKQRTNEKFHIFSCACAAAKLLFPRMFDQKPTVS